MTSTSVTRRNVEDREGIDRLDDESGASRPRQRAPDKSLSGNSSVRPRPDPGNPLLNPATSIRHVAEDIAPPQPNELPEPDGTPNASDADSAHPLGAHERQSSR